MPGPGMATASAWAAMVTKPKPSQLPSGQYGWHYERCCAKPAHDAWYVMHYHHLVEVHHDEEAARKRARHLLASGEPGPTVIQKRTRDEQRQYGLARG